MYTIELIFAFVVNKNCALFSIFQPAMLDNVKEADFYIYLLVVLFIQLHYIAFVDIFLLKRKFGNNFETLS